MKKIALCTMLTLLSVVAMNVEAKPLIVGHRGVPDYAPENTVPSQQLAWDLNADGAEFDIWLTKDKKLVVLHDKNTSRTAGAVNLDVKVAPADELYKVDVGAYKDPVFTGTLLPSFQDMLNCHPKGKVLVVEIKDGPETVTYAKKEIEATGRPLSEFRVISFNFDTCEEARKLMPDADVYWLKSATKDKNKKPEPFKNDVLDKAKAANLTGVNLDFHGITPEFVTKCKEMGMHIYVWTVDDEADVAQMTKWGVECITTNHVDKTRRYVEKALAEK